MRFFQGKKTEAAEARVPALFEYSHNHERFLPVSVPATVLETGFVNCLGLKEKK